MHVKLLHNTTDSDLYDFKQLDAQGRRIFPEAEAFRDEAQKQAQLRGKAYDASKVAYSAGDGGEAKTLSNKVCTKYAV
jgi:Domain of unknown function (DUF1771)